ncbi:hypothetical protein BaRGS_00000076 [Batillaria attramentaria]|uniref:Secreted protein n=1 Tax=Batillaria attramentaria TaxID=370345 RepID=A0ABD0MA55_9CAEN
MELFPSLLLCVCCVCDYTPGVFSPEIYLFLGSNVIQAPTTRHERKDNKKADHTKEPPPRRMTSARALGVKKACAGGQRCDKGRVRSQCRFCPPHHFHLTRHETGQKPMTGAQAVNAVVMLFSR